jgi:hypothetical protein
MQVRVRDFEEALTSYEHNLINLGIHKPGRFWGFNVIGATGPLTFQIEHTGGLRVRNAINELSHELGVVMTRQGVIIVETENITGLVLDSNVGNNNERIDLVVLNHQYSNLPGGSEATYSIIKGPTDSRAVPVLINPDYQIIIGKLYIPPQTSAMPGVKWMREKAPDSGDGEDARLTEVNKFTRLNQWYKSTLLYSTTTVIDTGANLWELRDDGNTFNLAPPIEAPGDPETPIKILDGIKIGTDPIQDGTEVILVINEKVQIRNSIQVPNAQFVAGYLPIKFNERISNEIATINGDPYPVIHPVKGEEWILKLLKIGDRWLVSNIEGPGHSDAFKRGMIIAVTMSTTDVFLNFDSTGLGIRLYKGWAIANGQNGTDDWMGRSPMGATISIPRTTPLDLGMEPNKVPSIVIGEHKGGPVHTLTIEEMPEHLHDIDGSTGTSFAGAGTVPGIAGTGQFEGAGKTKVAGNGQPHDNLHPVVGTLFIQRIS